MHARMRCLLLLALASACTSSNDFPGPPEFSGTYTLAQTRSIAGEHQIAGVDADGKGGIWIAYCDDADYYTPKNVWVTHLDKTGAKVSEWKMNDHFEQIRGITAAGDNVWLNYQASGAGDHFLRELDGKTGATLKMMTTDSEVADLAYDTESEQLLLSNDQHLVVAVDPASGSELWRTQVAATAATTQRGIAYDHGRLWLVEAFDNKFFYLDTDGTVHATATADALGISQTAELQLSLAWDGSQLIVATSDHIYWLKPQKA